MSTQFKFAICESRIPLAKGVNLGVGWVLKNNANSQFANCESQLPMRKHNGMRPQDVVILLKIIALRRDRWLMKDLALSIGISASEVSESLERSMFAGLIGNDKRKVMRLPLHEFLVHGIRYAFPVRPGQWVRGMETAQISSPLIHRKANDDKYVWPMRNGKVEGLTIQPLIDSVPLACAKDQDLYEALVLVDAIRIGKVDERSIAETELQKWIWKETQWIKY
jgi:hypothetical protein